MVEEAGNRQKAPSMCASINAALHQRLTEDHRVQLLGYDIADPYGGAFKVTRGLSSAFPDRVHLSSVSEAGLIGAATGMALAGHLPIVEIMFSDFLTLGFDQLLNHATKFYEMYGGSGDCRILIRSASGAGRGYGATHSQSPEKFFLGMPGLTLAAANLYVSPIEILRTLQMSSRPALFIEPKRLYSEAMRDQGFHNLLGFLRREFRIGALPACCLSMVPPEDCRLAVVSYGATASTLERVVYDLAIEEEIFCLLICVTDLNPENLEPLWHAVRAVDMIVFAEEGTSGWGWGTEWSYRAGQVLGGRLKRVPRCIANSPRAIPCGIGRENAAMLSEGDLYKLLREEAGRS